MRLGAPFSPAGPQWPVTAPGGDRSVLLDGSLPVMAQCVAHSWAGVATPPADQGMRTPWAPEAKRSDNRVTSSF